ncbi:unnamed protein product [Choristocarpus tenellus]
MVPCGLGHGDHSSFIDKRLTKGDLFPSQKRDVSSFAPVNDSGGADRNNIDGGEGEVLIGENIAQKRSGTHKAKSTVTPSQSQPAQQTPTVAEGLPNVEDDGYLKLDIGDTIIDEVGQTLVPWRLQICVAGLHLSAGIVNAFSSPGNHTSNTLLGPCWAAVSVSIDPTPAPATDMAPVLPSKETDVGLGAQQGLWRLMPSVQLRLQELSRSRVAPSIGAEQPGVIREDVIKDSSSHHTRSSSFCLWGPASLYCLDDLQEAYYIPKDEHAIQRISVIVKNLTVKADVPILTSVVISTMGHADVVLASGLLPMGGETRTEPVEDKNMKMKMRPDKVYRESNDESTAPTRDSPTSYIMWKIKGLEIVVPGCSTARDAGVGDWCRRSKAKGKGYNEEEVVTLHAREAQVRRWGLEELGGGGDKDMETVTCINKVVITGVRMAVCGHKVIHLKPAGDLIDHDYTFETSSVIERDTAEYHMGAADATSWNGLGTGPEMSDSSVGESSADALLLRVERIVCHCQEEGKSGSVGDGKCIEGARISARVTEGRLDVIVHPEVIVVMTEELAAVMRQDMVVCLDSGGLKSPYLSSLMADTFLCGTSDNMTSKERIQVSSAKDLIGFHKYTLGALLLNFFALQPSEPPHADSILVRDRSVGPTIDVIGVGGTSDGSTRPGDQGHVEVTTKCKCVEGVSVGLELEHVLMTLPQTPGGGLHETCSTETYPTVLLRAQRVQMSLSPPVVPGLDLLCHDHKNWKGSADAVEAWCDLGDKGKEELDASISSRDRASVVTVLEHGIHTKGDGVDSGESGEREGSRKKGGLFGLIAPFSLRAEGRMRSSKMEMVCCSLGEIYVTGQPQLLSCARSVSEAQLSALEILVQEWSLLLAGMLGGPEEFYKKVWQVSFGQSSVTNASNHGFSVQDTGRQDKMDNFSAPCSGSAMMGLESDSIHNDQFSFINQIRHGLLTDAQSELFDATLTLETVQEQVLSLAALADEAKKEASLEFALSSAAQLRYSLGVFSARALSNSEICGWLRRGDGALLGQRGRRLGGLTCYWAVLPKGKGPLLLFPSPGCPSVEVVIPLLSTTQILDHRLPPGVRVSQIVSSQKVFMIMMGANHEGEIMEDGSDERVQHTYSSGSLSYLLSAYSGQATAGQSHLLVCDSRVERESWIKALQNRIQIARAYGHNHAAKEDRTAQLSRSTLLGPSTLKCQMKWNRAQEKDVGLASLYVGARVEQGSRGETLKTSMTEQSRKSAIQLKTTLKRMVRDKFEAVAAVPQARVKVPKSAFVPSIEQTDQERGQSSPVTVPRGVETILVAKTDSGRMKTMTTTLPQGDRSVPQNFVANSDLPNNEVAQGNALYTNGWSKSGGYQRGAFACRNPLRSMSVRVVGVEAQENESAVQASENPIFDIEIVSLRGGAWGANKSNVEAGYKTGEAGVERVTSRVKRSWEDVCCFHAVLVDLFMSQVIPEVDEVGREEEGDQVKEDIFTSISPILDTGDTLLGAALVMQAYSGDHGTQAWQCQSLERYITSVTWFGPVCCADLLLKFLENSRQGNVGDAGEVANIDHDTQMDEVSLPQAAFSSTSRTSSASKILDGESRAFKVKMVTEVVMSEISKLRCVVNHLRLKDGLQAVLEKEVRHEEYMNQKTVKSQMQTMDEQQQELHSNLAVLAERLHRTEAAKEKAEMEVTLLTADKLAYMHKEQDRFDRLKAECFALQKSDKSGQDEVAFAGGNVDQSKEGITVNAGMQQVVSTLTVSVVQLEEDKQRAIQEARHLKLERDAAVSRASRAALAAQESVHVVVQDNRQLRKELETCRTMLEKEKHKSMRAEKEVSVLRHRLQMFYNEAKGLLDDKVLGSETTECGNISDEHLVLGGQGSKEGNGLNNQEKNMQSTPSLGAEERDRVKLPVVGCGGNPEAKVQHSTRDGHTPSKLHNFVYNLFPKDAKKG